MNKGKFIVGDQYSYKGTTRPVIYMGISNIPSVGRFEDAEGFYHYEYKNMVPCTQPENRVDPVEADKYSSKYWTYLIYLILWQGSVWGGTYYAVSILNETSSYFILAFVLGVFAYSPSKWMNATKDVGESNE